MGVPDELAQSSIRFGLGRFNTADEVEYTIQEVARVVRSLRAINPLCEVAERIPAEISR
jgi:cysteine desulfurase